MKLTMMILLIALPLAAEDPRLDSAPRTEQTPFGPSLRRRPPASPRPADHSLVSVEKQGDTMIFRRRTPFGDQVWQRRSDELNTIEKEMIAAQERRAAAPAAKR